jgi:hypothetical protein
VTVSASLRLNGEGPALVARPAPRLPLAVVNAAALAAVLGSASALHALASWTALLEGIQRGRDAGVRGIAGRGGPPGFQLPDPGLGGGQSGFGPRQVFLQSDRLREQGLAAPLDGRVCRNIGPEPVRRPLVARLPQGLDRGSEGRVLFQKLIEPTLLLQPSGLGDLEQLLIAGILEAVRPSVSAPSPGPPSREAKGPCRAPFKEPGKVSAGSSEEVKLFFWRHMRSS